MTVWRRWLAATLLLFAGTATAAPQFPPLTGRVVDIAGILSPAFEAELGAQLAAHEKTTTNQVVVVTLKTLGGYDIADYGYQLGRHWGIGQKGRNNGVLLIVAPTERKLRIEVGYGLEGALTDAISRDIIERRIKPAFRQQKYEQGIREGANAILSALAGDYRTAPPPFSALPPHTPDTGGFGTFFLVLLVAIVATAWLFRRFLAKRPSSIVPAALTGSVVGIIIWFVTSVLVIAVVLAVIAFILILLLDGGSRRGGGSGGGGDWGSGGGGWGGDGGGFSGGGGDFGGGGASGDW